MRLFIALPIPGPVKRALAGLQSTLPADGLPLDWQTKPRMHLTLHFLGECSEDRVEELTQTITQVASGYAAFPLRMTQLGLFPSTGQPQVLWIGIEDNPPLIAMQHELGLSLAADGFRTESRDYHPHITLARTRQTPTQEQYRAIRQLKGHHVTLVERSWTADRITLYHSHHDEYGLHYSPLAEASLAP